MTRAKIIVAFLAILFVCALTLSVIAYSQYRATAYGEWYKDHNIEPDFIKPYYLSSYGLIVETLGVVLILASFAVLKHWKIAGLILIMIAIFATASVFGSAISSNGTMLGVIGNGKIPVALYLDQVAQPNINTIYHYIFDCWARLSPPMAVSTNLAWNNTFGYLLVDVYNGTWISNTTSPPPEYGGALTPYLLQCGIETAGGTLDTSTPFPTWKWTDTSKFRLIIFVCGGTMDMIGLGVRDWNAMIIQEPWATSTSPASMEHELGHIFGCEHCPNWCVMNPDAVQVANYAQFCPSCQAKVIYNLNNLP